MKGIGLLLLIISGMAILQACTDERCIGDNRQYFDVRGFTVANVLRPDTTWDFTNSYIQEIDSTFIIPAHRLGIELRGQIQFYAASEGQFSSFGVAYACSPAMPGQSGSQEQISHIEITSDSDYNSTHPAGANLNQYFRVSAIDYQHFAPADSLNNEAIPLAAFLSHQPKARNYLQLWLTERPENNLEHRFTVRYLQTNGEQYVVTAPKITFL